MKITIPSKVLKERMSFLDQVAKKRITGISYGNMRLRVDGDILSITAINQRLCVTERLTEFTSDGDLDMVIESEVILPVIKMVGSGDIELEQMEDYTLMVRYPDGELKSKAGRVEVFPIVYKNPDTEPIVLDIERFVPSIRKAAMFTRVEEFQPAMDNVCVEISGKDIFVVSTDRMNMYRHRFDNETNIPDGTVYVSTETANLLDKYARGKKGFLSIRKDDRRTYFHMDDVDIYELGFNGVYWQWRLIESIVPNGGTLTFRKAALMDSLARCQSVNNSWMNLRYDGEVLHVDSEDVLMSLSIKDRIIPSEAESDPMDICLSVDPLRRCISALSGGDITLKRCPERRCVAFSDKDDGNERVLIMESVPGDDPKAGKKRR